MYTFIINQKFEHKMSESKPNVELQVVEVATEQELEVVSLEPSINHGDRETF